jgi:hypothetical protein
MYMITYLTQYNVPTYNTSIVFHSSVAQVSIYGADLLTVAFIQKCVLSPRMWIEDWARLAGGAVA